MVFKDSLNRLMKEKGVIPAALHRATGISEGNISEYLSGAKEPLGKTSVAIAKALGVSLDDLWEHELPEMKDDSSSSVINEFHEKDIYNVPIEHDTNFENEV